MSSKPYHLEGKIYQDVETVKEDVYYVLYRFPDPDDRVRGLKLIQKNLLKTTWGADFLNTARHLLP